MKITTCNKKEKNEIKGCYPDAYSFIKTADNNNIVILFKTKAYYGKYNIITKEYQIVSKKTQVFINNIKYLE
mgnify:CR=1 FL=1